jgi:uncharacterized protein (TIGR03435 family)
VTKDRTPARFDPIGFAVTQRRRKDAKADRGGHTLDELHDMYKNMPADQFKLRFHWETREGPVYLLMIDKFGLKMKVDDSPEPFKVGVPIAGDPTSPGGVIGHGVAMEYLTWWLGQQWDNDYNRTSVR